MLLCFGGLSVLLSQILHENGSPGLRIAVCCVVAALLARQWSLWCACLPVLSQFEDGSWHVERCQGRHRFEGRLMHGGYRSSLLVVLVFRSEQGPVHRVALWRDQLTGPEFSHLHHQMAFNSQQECRTRYDTRA